jgi:hypothetical protein
MKRLVAGVGLTLFGAVLAVSGCKKDDHDYLVKKFGSPSDSPVVVRGGSLNFIANAGSAPRWQSNGSLYVVQNVPLNTLYLDGVIPSGSTSIDPVSQASPVMPANYWTITLALRKGSGNVIICTQTTTDGHGRQVCNLSPTGVLPSNTRGPIYVQGDSSNTLAIDDFDRSKRAARMHYKISSCNLSGVDGLGNPTDLDPECDKIKTISIQDGPSNTTTFSCVDGACDIGIGPPPQ